MGKPPPVDKTTGLDPGIRFYAIEGDGDTEEGEEVEILVVNDSNLAISKKYLVKRKLPYTNTFNHEGPALVSAMRNLNFGVFEHIDCPKLECRILIHSWMKTRGITVIGTVILGM